ncbi:MAG: YcxB family protein [Clostridium paraputrificum]
MEFEFNNTLRELLELRLNTIKKRKLRTSNILYFTIAAIFIVGVLWEVIVNRNDSTIIIIILGIFLVILYFVFKMVIKVRNISLIQYIIEQDSHLVSNKLVKFDEDKITIRQDGKEEIIFIEDITKIIENRLSLCIYVRSNGDKNKDYVGLIIPLNILNSEEKIKICNKIKSVK